VVRTGPRQRRRPESTWGSLPQQVEKTFPQWVRTGADGYRVLAPEGFEAVTVEAVRTVNQKVDAVAAENVMLRSA